MLEVTLPWPPRELSPNMRVHWAKKAKFAKAYRSACGMLTLAAYQQAKKNGLRIDPERPVNVELLFVPPNRRNYDADNCVAQTKNGFDGLADGLGVNDRMFRFGPPVVSDQLGGMVKVRVSQ